MNNPAAEIRRTDYTSHVNAAAPDKEDDPSYRGTIAAEAIRLDPLKQIQVSFDQTVLHAEHIRRGDPWVFGGSFSGHLDLVIKHAVRRYDVLHTAAEAARSMIAEFRDQHMRPCLGAADDTPPTPEFIVPFATQAEYDAGAAEIDRLITKGELSVEEGERLDALDGAAKAWQDNNPL